MERARALVAVGADVLVVGIFFSPWLHNRIPFHFRRF